jgi:peroxiredoxin
MSALFLGAMLSCQAQQPGSKGEQDIEAVQAEPKPKAPQDALKGESDTFAVPDGTPEQLERFLEDLLSQKPTARDPASVKAFATKVGRAALEAGQRILAAKPRPKDEQAATGVRAQMLGYNILAQLGDKQSAQKLQDMPGTLEKAGWPKLVRLARTALLQIELGQAAIDEPGVFKKLLERIRKHLADGPIQEDEVRLAYEATMTAADLGDDVAAVAYGDLGAELARSTDKKVATLAAKMQGAARRLALVGQKPDLEGKTVSGKPLDWAKYRGKTVLVQFWATWCGPCRKAIAQIRPLYRAYHDKGFDVVGISVDKEREDLDAFLKDADLPWVIVADTDAIGAEKDGSMGTKYGVFGIPEMWLVDKDGKVVARGLSPDALAQAVEKEYGPVPEPKPPGK